MAISVEVAKATGWRKRKFPGMNCREILFLSQGQPGECLLDNLSQFFLDTVDWARSESERIQKKLNAGKN